MRALVKKSPADLDKDLTSLMKILKFGTEHIFLKGSAAIRALKYYGDYDIYTNITHKYKAEAVYDIMSEILNAVLEADNVRFIEMKVQTTKGKKRRWGPDDEFNYPAFKRAFKDVAFIKIDLVLFTNYAIVEVSSNYDFHALESTEDYIKDINDSKAEYEKAGNYYKALKREYSILAMKGDEAALLKLNDFFNKEEIGKNYQLSSAIDAMRLLLHHYPEEAARVKKALGEYKITNLKAAEAKQPHIMKAINTEAKKLL